LFVAAVGGTTEAASTTVDIPLLGSNEVPPVSGPGSGLARVTFDSATNVLSYQITISGISGSQVTAAHIHRGAVGISGPVVYPLATSSFTTLQGQITLTAADVADLMAGNLYINVHSQTNPDGFARGQLLLNADSSVRQALQEVQDAYNAKDFAGFASRITDKGIQESFGEDSRAQFLQDLPDITSGPPLTINVLDVQVTGDKATATVILDFTAFKEVHRFELIRQNGVWLMDGDQPAQVPAPAGFTSVNLTLDEFNFQYDKSAVAKGNFVFQVTNKGDQPHEVALVRLAPNVNLQQALNESSPESGPPAGIADVAHGGPYAPGTSGTLLIDEPLTPGRYALLCFVTDPASGLPHAMLGMTSEFTVGGGAGGAVSPPNTGDGGLVHDSGTSSLSYVALAFVVLFAGGAITAGYRRTHS
jgi:hypothetical protein